MKVPGLYLSCLLYVAFTKCENEINVMNAESGLLDLWKLRQTNNTQDIFEATKMYKDIEKQQQALSELHQSTRRFLREENANMLSEILSGNGSTTHFQKLQTVYETFIKNYDMPFIEDIFHDAIDQVYNDKTPSKLLDDLWTIYTPTDNAKSFELMVRAQLILCSIHNTKSYSHHEYLQKWSLVIYKIMNNVFFKNLDKHLKSGIERAVAELPDYLNYLIFKPYFCMFNIAHSEFIYAAVNSMVDANSRYIWLWYEKYFIDSSGHIKSNIVNDDFENFQITLLGKNNNVYYYMMPNSKNIIAGWASSNVDPFNHIWNVEFKDNNVIFSQNGYIMCSTESYDPSRRYINGYKNLFGFDAENPACQWSVGNCDRRH